MKLCIREIPKDKSSISYGVLMSLSKLSSLAHAIIIENLKETKSKSFKNLTMNISRGNAILHA